MAVIAMCAVVVTDMRGKMVVVGGHRASQQNRLLLSSVQYWLQKGSVEVSNHVKVHTTSPKSPVHPTMCSLDILHIDSDMEDSNVNLQALDDCNNLPGTHESCSHPPELF